MESLLEHVRVATTMYKNKLNLKFIKEFKIKEIEDCCTQLENLHVDNKIYESSEIIERELIKDTNSIKYLTKIFESNVAVQEEYTIYKIESKFMLAESI